MKVKKAEPLKRGRPRGMLRDWYRDNLPKVRTVKHFNPEIKKAVEVFIPEIDSQVEIDIPKGWHPIPPELTEGKTQATIGQTARNEVRTLGIKDKRFTVHEIPVEMEMDKKGKTFEFSLFAVEAVQE